MKRACWLVLVLGLSLSSHSRAAVAQGAHGSELKRVTLYGSIKYRHDFSRALFSFKTGTFNAYPGADLEYGTLRVNDDWDWFKVSTAEGVRTAIRDLGAHGWEDSFRVPVVEPFPKLEEGERRRITVDASGADGEDGADGAPGADAGGMGEIPWLPAAPARRPRRPKRDGVPKVDPVYSKAVAGHMYVLRVVDGEEDFYVLFRVEKLERGDNCTISWKRIPPPAAKAAPRY